MQMQEASMTFGPHPSRKGPSLKLEVSLWAPLLKLEIEKMRNAI